MVIFVFYDTYKRLCELQGGTPTGIAQELGIGKSTVSGWKTRGSAPRAEQLAKIAARLNVSTDYLLGNTPEKENPATDSDGFTEAERRDIAKEVERMMADLENQGDLMFDGDPATPEALQTIRTAFEIGLTNARMLNKKKQEKG